MYPKTPDFHLSLLMAAICNIHDNFVQYRVQTHHNISSINNISHFLCEVWLIYVCVCICVSMSICLSVCTTMIRMMKAVFFFLEYAMCYFQEHRVIDPTRRKTIKKRQSLICFFGPDDDCILPCLDGSDLYEPITYQQLFAQNTFYPKDWES